MTGLDNDFLNMTLNTGKTRKDRQIRLKKFEIFVHWVQQVKPPPGTLLSYTGLPVTAPAAPLSFFASAPRKAAEHGPSVQASASPCGDPDGDARSWHSPGPATATAANKGITSR